MRREDTRPWQIGAMLAEEFPISEAPTNPIGPRLVPSPRRTHLMLVGTPRLSTRGRAWLQRASSEFDGPGLQRMLTLERLSLG